MHTPEIEKALCLKNAAAIAARHVSPAALEAATADIARELEKARLDAVQRTFAAAGTGFDKASFAGAQRCLKKASLDMAILGDAKTALGLMAVGLLLKVVQDSVHNEAAGAPGL
jgi:hypothetical protein